MCYSAEYTIMAESLERCFSRALQKHFPSEDGDTDEEFHLNKDDRERKDKKRTKNSSRQSGPESLIRATEQAQKRKTTSGGSLPQENGSKSAHGPPGFQFGNMPTHPHNMAHPRSGNEPLHGMYHPSQQASLHFVTQKRQFYRVISQYASFFFLLLRFLHLGSSLDRFFMWFINFILFYFF